MDKAIADPDPVKAAKIVATLGLLADAKTNELLHAARHQTAQAADGDSHGGGNGAGPQCAGAEVAAGDGREGQCCRGLQVRGGQRAVSSPDEAIRTAAGKAPVAARGAGGEPLPPVAELVKRSGDAGRGKELFFGIGTCVKCHKVKGEGKEVGPDLSEIGTKLSKEALYVSILDPSAGVSFNYETWLVRTTTARR